MKFIIKKTGLHGYVYGFSVDYDYIDNDDDDDVLDINKYWMKNCNNESFSLAWIVWVEMKI